MSLMRLDKYLSDLGLASRREVKELIRTGRVTVNGACAVKAEEKIEADSAVVAVDGRVVHYRKNQYFMMDKPEGVITATEDGRQKTVLDLLPPELKRLGLFPVGRLDKDTSGLLILTDDGDFSHRVTAPRQSVSKCYLAEVDGVPDESDVAAFREGVTLADGTRCLPAGLEIDGSSICRVTVREGKYHQVKRMLASRGKPVQKLRRLSIGSLLIDENLGPGGFRELSDEELCRVFIDK